MNNLNINGVLALRIHADQEHVKVVKELLGEIIEQIDKSCLQCGLSDVASENLVETGLICLLKEVADSKGFHELYYDLSKLRS